MRAWLIFYKTLALPLIGITLICGFQVLQAHSVYFIFRVLWVKVLTSAVIATYVLLFRSQQFIFYNNLGYSKVRLLAFSFLFDFLLSLVVMLTVSLLL